MVINGRPMCLFGKRLHGQTGDISEDGFTRIVWGIPSCACIETKFAQLQNMPRLRLDHLSRPSSLASQPTVVHTCYWPRLYVELERNKEMEIRLTFTGPNLEVLDMNRHIEGCTDERE
jgi:hypothetical protein